VACCQGRASLEEMTTREGTSEDELAAAELESTIHNGVNDESMNCESMRYPLEHWRHRHTMLRV
jgi:hypothetical protein